MGNKNENGSDVTADVPQGQRFSHVYIHRGQPVEDSRRMRVRMRSLVMSDAAVRTSTVVEDKLGVDVL